MMLLGYTAPEHVRGAIAALGRTEDVKFSPGNHRLALVSLLKNQITVFELCIDRSTDRRKIALTDVAIISSPYLKQPHGISFIDDERIIVANRLGDAAIFKLPAGRGGKSYELAPIGLIRSGNLLTSPGAVSITKTGENSCEALICSNFGNTVTKHLIDLDANCSVKSTQVLLRRWLALPDGVSVHVPWIAISNHDTHTVLLYENTGSLNPCSPPDGILRGALYPHGLRFTADGLFILVADAGAPYVHIYGKGSSGWRGVRSPLKSRTFCAGKPPLTKADLKESILTDR
jgi:hypothetical protein